MNWTTWLSLNIACHPANNGDSGVQLEAEETGNNGMCINSLETIPMPDQRITDYGVDVPTLESVLPDKLSETGLYTDIETETIHPAIHWFKPQYELWSDGESKNRWAYIPECEQIDSTNMNDWSFPVGTRFFKEFSVDGVKVETRYIVRLGPGKREFAFASYVWNQDQTEAYKVGPEGLSNALGTTHQVPSWEQCVQLNSCVFFCCNFWDNCFVTIIISFYIRKFNCGINFN